MISAGQGRFEGKVAIITGSSTGIGAAVATRLAAEGASVVLSGRRMQLLEAKAVELKEQGFRVLAVPGDVSSTAATVVQRAIEEFGQIDILVNNAAISAGVGIEEMTLDG